MISIPVLLLWNVRLPLRQKLMLLAIFSLTIFVMIVAIIRVTIVQTYDRNVDMTWVYFWNNIEVTTCKCKACSIENDSSH